MQKVGILTYHFTINFGATLQAYALNQVIKELGYDVEFIDYRPNWIRILDLAYLYWGFFGRNYLPNFYFLNGVNKLRKMRKFLVSNMKLSPSTYYTTEDLKKFQNKYDILLCGSDEIWNSDKVFDPSYFFDFVSNENTKKLTYAASFGATTSVDDHKDVIKDLLHDFSFISVRDNNSMRLVNECKRDAVKVLDPTFLGDFTAIIKYPNIKKEYILVYSSLSEAEGKYIRSVADAEGLDVVYVGSNPGKGNGRINFIGIGPDEWLGYFAKASHVFTSFYHGVIFSIIFKKNFNYLPRSNKSVKVEDLLNDLGLENRKLDIQQASQLKPKLSKEMNWENKKLDQMIQQSKQYLIDSLNA